MCAPYWPRTIAAAGFIKIAMHLGANWWANVKDLIQGWKRWLRESGQTDCSVKWKRKRVPQQVATYDQRTTIYVSHIYVDYTGARVFRLAKKVLAVEQGCPHFRAVQAQCAFAIEAYSGVLRVVDAQNGVAAVSLGRTLFEAVVSAVILAKHQEKLEDFKNHGKLTTLQMARSVPPGSRFDSPGLRKFRVDTEAECDALQAYFKPTRNWHLLKNSDAFAEAELPENFRDRYYIRVSAVAHGHPFAVVQQFDKEGKNWKIQEEPEEWKKWAEKERVMSMLLMLHMIERLSRVFALGLESEIAPVSQQIWGAARQQMQTLRPSG
jgi:hypothetical protein